MLATNTSGQREDRTSFCVPLGRINPLIIFIQNKSVVDSHQHHIFIPNFHLRFDVMPVPRPTYLALRLSQGPHTLLCAYPS